MKPIIFSIVVTLSVCSSLSARAERTYLIQSPVHKDSQLPLSYKSDENGVCKYLGYERAVGHSAMKGTYSRTTTDIPAWQWAVPLYGLIAGGACELGETPEPNCKRNVTHIDKGPSIRLDQNGNILSQNRDIVLGQITCISDRTDAPKLFNLEIAHTEEDAVVACRSAAHGQPEGHPVGKGIATSGCNLSTNEQVPRFAAICDRGGTLTPVYGSSEMQARNNCTAQESDDLPLGHITGKVTEYTPCNGSGFTLVCVR